MVCRRNNDDDFVDDAIVLLCSSTTTTTKNVDKLACFLLFLWSTHFDGVLYQSKVTKFRYSPKYLQGSDCMAILAHHCIIQTFKIKNFE